ncbi:dihydroxyacetone kinase subunit DhaL [Halocella sp. SP3-1]|uniref:dihydroxyacetone kinase subunit DhaL n=1 Tax=Halocella sp. SP3-1 TaxID=2382161 RepID=UPI000F74C9A1|nr:dihydroxyacetone kinase subunit DhaL [Halocella sp. SP3-1]AZO93309.1 dihydroxyacetone kinase subunit L [Halocella sp. SP3-1]
MKLKIDEIKGIVKAIRDTMHKKREYLIELDSVMGDGDLGLTMCKGFDSAVEAIESYDGDDIGQGLLKISMSMSNAAGTMGILLASAIMSAAKASKGKEILEADDLVEMAYAAIEGIKKRGKAKVGDKTILDSLVPAAEALDVAVKEGKELPEAYRAAAEAAAEGVEKTKEMVSQFGRAHYYGEKSRGNQDPGATAALLICQAISDYLN